MTESGGPLKRTPLYEEHVSLGGKIVPFAGWELPVQYSGVIAEHEAVRQRAGLFDVSHMGEILVSGPQAEAALQYLTCNDLRAIANGKGQYNALINPRGGVVDDIIVYRMSADRFFVCVNASNTDKDFAWCTSHNKFDATFENVSSRYGQLALQGPRSPHIMAKLRGGSEVANLPYFNFRSADIENITVIVARTGYTGEDGFEIFVPWEHTVTLWRAILAAGTDDGLIPCGLGARDSLRLEACYPLHGHELGDDITAIESALGWIVKPDKGDFIGKSILAEQKAKGAPRALVGFYLKDPGIARQEFKVFSSAGEEIGVVTSGTQTPTIRRALGLALVAKKYAVEGTELAIDVRGRKLKAEVVKRPFYKKPVI